MLSDDENSSSDEEYEGTSIKGRDSFIYVIDSLMFKNPDHFNETLILIRETFLAGIIAHPKQLIAVVFHNTKHSPMPKDISGMEDIVVLNNQAVFLPLKSLSKDIISYYQEFVLNSNSNFEHKYGFEEGSFVNTIRLCFSMFHNCRPKPGSETIVYFTNLETPHTRNSDEYNKAILKANDLRDINVDFEVIPMIEHFDYNAFYKEFMCLVKGTDIETFEVKDMKYTKEMFKSHQLAMNLKGRCITQLKWILEDGFELSVGYYNLFSKTFLPKSVKLLRSDNSIIDVKRVKELKYLDELGLSEETRLLLPGDEANVLKCPGEPIVLSAEQVSKLRTPIPPALQLIGFIENNTIPLDMYIKTSGFIYPTESNIVGSTKLFRAIWQKCIDMNKMAVCILVKTKKSYPDFVALEASQSGFNGNIKAHDGFNVFYLPSVDNNRNIDTTAWKSDEPTDEQVAFFKQVVKKLRVNYDPQSKALTDPALDYLNAKILSLAFDLETENLENELDPDIDEQDQRMNISLEELVRLFGEVDVSATKRPGTANAGEGNAVKKAKIVNSDITEQMIIEMVGSKSLEDLTAVQLRQYLQQKGETNISKVTKPNLISRVMNLHI
ncbi:XRCC6 family protein [Megaselia abdita]